MKASGDKNRDPGNKGNRNLLGDDVPRRDSPRIKESFIIKMLLTVPKLKSGDVKFDREINNVGELLRGGERGRQVTRTFKLDEGMWEEEGLDVVEVVVMVVVGEADMI